MSFTINVDVDHAALYDLFAQLSSLLGDTGTVEVVEKLCLVRPFLRARLEEWLERDRPSREQAATDRYQTLRQRVDYLVDRAAACEDRLEAVRENVAGLWGKVRRLEDSRGGSNHA